MRHPNPFSSFLDARQQTGMSDCFENLCAEGSLECGGEAAAVFAGVPKRQLRCRTPRARSGL